MDLGAQYQIQKRVQLFVQIDNLLNHRYYTAAQLGPSPFDNNGNFVARPFSAVDGNFPIQTTTFFAPGAPIGAWGGLPVHFITGYFRTQADRTQIHIIGSELQRRQSRVHSIFCWLLFSNVSSSRASSSACSRGRPICSAIAGKVFVAADEGAGGRGDDEDEVTLANVG